MRFIFQTLLEEKCAFSKHHVIFQYMVDFAFQSFFVEGLPQNMHVFIEKRIQLHDTSSIGTFEIQPKNARFYS